MFDILSTKWKCILIGESTDELVSIYEEKLISHIDALVEIYYEELCQDTYRSYLWKDEADFTQSQKQTNNYRRIFEMCKAYSIPGSKYYKSESLLTVIQEALRFLDEVSYNTTQLYYYGNWWNWEIGTPITLLNIITLLGDALDEAERLKYCEVIRYYQPNPKRSGERSENPKLKRRTSVGGNRVDTAKIAILLGIHTKDKALIQEGIAALSDVFQIKEYAPMNASNEKRDGIYKDWSFIQHGDVAYTGTYGNVMLGGLGELIYLLSESPFRILDPNVNTIYEMINRSFIPIIYKGHGMDLVNGRGATREAYQNNGTGYAIISSILWFCQFAPKKYQEVYQSRIKYWLQNDKIGSYVEKSDNRASIRMALRILEDESIEVAKALEGNFAYNYMDRMIHHRPRFSCALSMSSYRIRTYEPMLGENKRGFYTGDGMLYIYTDNQEEYNQDFWATVDPYKLTGTTVIEKKIEDEQGSFRPASRWVSAMSVKELYGIAGMQLDKTGINDETGELENPLGIDLTGKKSYFMLEDEIVALGCGITSTNPEKVSTIVDTRKTKKVGGYKIHQEGRSIYLENNQEETSIGYYFFQKSDLKVETYTREGSWYTVNINGTKELKKQDYITIWAQHGRAPKNESYAYMMLPGVSREKMAIYKEYTPIEVLANKEEVQAIQYKNMIMANFFEASHLKWIHVNQPVSMVLEENENEIEITLCDPTKENKNLLKIVLKQNVILGEQENNITLEKDASNSVITINWEERYGQNVRFKLKKANLKK